ncbi:hypothetical protein HYV22_01960 [Candidatus Gottesmanbacteria bacterium]|nr:hypothetical protein [Candidatus Gottesmanbacteria bacterium]
MKPVKSPHFPRIFTASPVIFVSKGILWSFLILLLSLNILARGSVDSYWSKHLQVLMNPTSPIAHLTLAQEHWQIGDWQKAKNELLITQELSQYQQPNSDVLGLTISPLDLLREWAQEPARLAKELQFWQTIMKEKPDYRDAYLQASVLSFKLNKLDDARGYLDQATSLDPNFPIASHLSQLLNTFQSR